MSQNMTFVEKELVCGGPPGGQDTEGHHSHHLRPGERGQGV